MTKRFSRRQLWVLLIQLTLFVCLFFVKERFVIHITDLLAVSMMLGITAQVKEAGIAWDKGEKKSKQNNLGSL